MGAVLRPVDRDGASASCGAVNALVARVVPVVSEQGWARIVLAIYLVILVILLLLVLPDLRAPGPGPYADYSATPGQYPGP